MSIQQLCYDAHARLRNNDGIAVRRTHLYEILAALLGYRSYAALTAQAVIGQSRQVRSPDRAALAGAEQRSLSLGYSADQTRALIGSLAEMVETHRLLAVDFAHLIREMTGHAQASGRDEVAPGDDSTHAADFTPLAAYADLDSPLLIDGLERGAHEGGAEAHYVLALLRRCEPPDDRDGHWHRQRLAGRTLAGIEQEWADDYAAALAQFESFRQHLEAAARLGYPSAAIDYAELSGEFADFERALGLTTATEAHRLADLAEDHGVGETALPLLRQAAATGDIEAMRRLAEDFEADPLEAWTWVHLAALCGRDLTRMEAVYDDGSPADDDIPGNLFAVGGIDLPDIDATQHAQAKQEAARRWAAMGSPGH